MSTIKDVALRAGVSVGTVSNYLTGARSVAPETAKSIQSAIEALEYTPNSYAKNLRTSNNQEIGVILPNTYDPYYASILAGAEQELKTEHFYVNLALSHDIPEDEISILRSFMKKDVCGLIVISCQDDERHYERIKKKPAVFIDRLVMRSESNFLSFRQYDTVMYLMRQLREQGCRRIGLIAGLQSFSCESDCARAYRDFYRVRGETPDERYLRHIRLTKEEAFRTGVSYFESDPPDAVICTSRIVSSGLEKAAAVVGLKPGKDIIMVSFGLDNWSSRVSDSGVIRTMRPAHDIGKMAARLLMSNLQSPLLFEKQQIYLDDKILGHPLFEPPRPMATPLEPQKPLRVLLLDSPNAHAVLQTRLDFTRKTGIPLDITLCSHNALLDKLMTNTADELPFDVCMYDNPWLDILVDADRLTPMDELVQAPDFDKSLFLAELPEKVGFTNGRYYGIPFLFGPQLLLYRKDWFENPALCEQFERKYRTKLRVPRTWFEFNVVSSFFTHALNPNSPAQYGTAIAAGNASILLPELMPRIWAYGGSVFDAEGNVAVDSPAFTKGVVNFLETFQYADPNTVNFNVEQTVEAFYTGKIAMLIGFASFVVDVNNQEKSRIVGKIGYSHIPGKYSVLSSWGLGVPKGCARRRDAYAFIRWTCDPSMSNYFAILDGQSPLENVYTSDELASHYPWLPIIYKSYAANRQRKSLRQADGSLVPITVVESIIYKYCSQLLQGNTSVHDALRKLRQEIERLM